MPARPPADPDHRDHHPPPGRLSARDLERIALDTITGPAGTIRQRTELTKTQRDILAQLRIGTPAEELPAHHRNALTRQDTTA